MHCLFQFWWITCCFPSVWLDLVTLPLAEIVRDAGETSVYPDIVGQLSSRYSDVLLQWPQKVVIAGFGQGKKWREMKEDWLMLLYMSAFCIFCWFALWKLIGISWLFSFDCLICIIASFLQERVSNHWVKNVGDMCQVFSPSEWHRVDQSMPVESLGCTIPLPHVFGL